MKTRWYQPATWVRAAIRSYQRLVSSRTPATCRYLPTCSEYALDAVGEYGAVRGVWLAVRRIARCNPWATDGFAHDPVPPRREGAHV